MTREVIDTLISGGVLAVLAAGIIWLVKIKSSIKFETEQVNALKDKIQGERDKAELEKLNSELNNHSNCKKNAETQENYAVRMIKICGIIIAFWLVFLVIQGIVNSRKQNNNQEGNTVTPTAMPTETPTTTPIVWADSDKLPYSSFQEEGKTKYGELTKYIGMTAGDLIGLIGKPYEYQAVQDQETGSTGGLWFDQDVVFTFCDSGKTLDMSCRVYMVWVQNHSGMGMAKNLGNGISANMNSDMLTLTLGSSLMSCYFDKLQGGITLGARCGDFLYDFRWGVGGTHYDLGFAPDRIIIYKHMVDDTRGAGSIEELINRYLWAYQFQDSEMMLNLIYPQELDSISLHLGMNREDIEIDLSDVLNNKREKDNLPIYFDLLFRHELSEERDPIERDYQNLLRLESYKHSRYKPERIAIFDEVYLTNLDGEKYTLVEGSVVGLCFDGRWYIPSFFTGFWGYSMEEALSNEKGYESFTVK